MSDPVRLSEARIAIIGLGLMGGSLAMALKGKCEMVIGVDTNPEATSYALENGFIDRTAATIEGIQDVHVVILAVPVGNILELIHHLPKFLPEGAMVMDIGSTKREIVETLAQLPEQFDPIGAHPMCGKENLTIFNADAQLFQNAPFAITPLERTTENARDMAFQLAETIGANPFVIEAGTHDRWTAATSHLPFLISLALAVSTPQEVKPLVGPGFKSTVRLAGTPASMMLDILRTNDDEVLKQCQHFISTLTEISALIENSDFEKLSELMETGKAKKEFFTTGGTH